MVGASFFGDIASGFVFSSVCHLLPYRFQENEATLVALLGIAGTTCHVGSHCGHYSLRQADGQQSDSDGVPEEVVYVPDMLVTLVALSNFTWQCDNRY